MMIKAAENTIHANLYTFFNKKLDSARALKFIKILAQKVA